MVMRGTFGGSPVQGREAIGVLGVAVAVGEGQELTHERDDPGLGGQVQGRQALVLPLPAAVQDARHHADVPLRCRQLCRAVPVPILQDHSMLR